MLTQQHLPVLVLSATGRPPLLVNLGALSHAPAWYQGLGYQQARVHTVSHSDHTQATFHSLQLQLARPTGHKAFSPSLLIALSATVRRGLIPHACACHSSHGHLSSGTSFLLLPLLFAASSHCSVLEHKI